MRLAKLPENAVSLSTFVFIVTARHHHHLSFVAKISSSSPSASFSILSILVRRHHLYCSNVTSLYYSMVCKGHEIYIVHAACYLSAGMVLCSSSIICMLAKSGSEIKYKTSNIARKLFAIIVVRLCIVAK